MTTPENAPLTPTDSSSGLGVPPASSSIVPAEPAIPVVPTPDATTKGEKRKAEKASATPESKKNPVGWSALLVAAVALASQSLFLNFVVERVAGGVGIAYNPAGVLWDSANGIASFMLVLTLAASFAAMVIAIVALFGRRKPLAISWVSFGVGLAVFVSTVSFWQGVVTLV